MKIHSLVGLLAIIDGAVDGHNFESILYEPHKVPYSTKEAIESETYYYHPSTYYNLPSTYNQSQGRSSDRVHELFRVYVEQHSVHVLRTESDEQLCKRNFVSNYYHPLECNSIGKSLGSALNNAIYAVVLNRTFLANYDFLGESCQGYLSLFPWVPTADEIRTRLEKSACPLPVDILVYYHFPLVGYSASLHRVVSEDDLFNAAPVHLRRDPTVHPFVRARADFLFGAKNGIYEPYGVLSSLMFNFSTILHTSVETFFRDVGKNALTVGMHLRYKSMKKKNDAAELMERSMHSLHQIRNLHKNEECVVYLATDRNRSINTVTASARSINCSVVSIAKFLSKNQPLLNIPDVHSSRRLDQSSIDEQDPSAKVLIQLADVLLLSRSRYYIGTNKSTFSIFIANYVAARNMDMDENCLFWV